MDEGEEAVDELAFRETGVRTKEPKREDFGVAVVDSEEVVAVAEMGLGSNGISIVKLAKMPRNRRATPMRFRILVFVTLTMTPTTPRIPVMASDPFVGAEAGVEEVEVVEGVVGTTTIKKMKCLTAAVAMTANPNRQKTIKKPQLLREATSRGARSMLNEEADNPTINLRVAVGGTTIITEEAVISRVMRRNSAACGEICKATARKNRMMVATTTTTTMAITNLSLLFLGMYHPALRISNRKKHPAMPARRVAHLP